MNDFLHLLSSPDPQNGPVPFWFLNDRLSRWEIRSQLTDFHAHGVPGVVIHPRMGFDASVPYLSERYMDWMEFICETAQSLSMFVYLYDEGMYPSGSACGQVVRENPAYAAKALDFSDMPIPEGRPVALFALPCSAQGEPEADRTRVIHSPSECLPGEVLRYASCVDSRGTIRGLHPDEDDGGPNAPAAADLLNPEAVECFIRLTHDRYWAKLSRFFGSTVRAMFTDEPSPLGRNVKPSLVSWTDGMEKEWQEAGCRLEDLPLLFLPGQRAEEVRTRHALLVRSHMMHSYYAPLQAWCEQHGIALIGHPAWPDAMDMEEAFTVPGQDLVWGWVARGESSLSGPESTLALCAADAALHSGKPVSLCECFGCCGPKESQWGMTVSDIKWMADWLFVRGISQLVPHAFFYSLRLPEARADRPPDVGPNNIFWPYYNDFSTYTARMCTLNHDRFSLATTAVLTDGISLDDRIARELFTRQIPFHYLTVSQLLGADPHHSPLHFPGQHVSLILVPASLHLTESLTQHLESFRQSGGLVVFASPAGWTDALACARAPMRFDSAPDLRVSWQRRDGDEYILLVNEGEACHPAFRLEKPAHMEIMDAWTGRISDFGSLKEGTLSLGRCQSLILRLSAPESPSEAQPVSIRAAQTVDVSEFLSAPEGSGPAPVRQVYTLSLLAFPSAGPVSLCFTQVHDMLELSCGAFRAHVLTEPWEVPLPDGFCSRPQKLVLTVTGSRVTEMDGIPWPCGLSGPVLLRFTRP